MQEKEEEEEHTCGIQLHHCAHTEQDWFQPHRLYIPALEQLARGWSFPSLHSLSSHLPVFTRILQRCIGKR